MAGKTENIAGSQQQDSLLLTNRTESSKISDENQNSYRNSFQNQRQLILGEKQLLSIANSPQIPLSTESNKLSKRLSATSSFYQKFEPSNIDSLESQEMPKLFRSQHRFSQAYLSQSIKREAQNLISSDSIKVIVRIRPGLYKEQGCTSVVRVDDSKIVLKHQQQNNVQQNGRALQYNVNAGQKPLANEMYSFDYVSGPETTQDRFFAIVGRPMIENCLAGYNSTIFAYGQTGSGKTYTMLGELPEDIDQYNLHSGLIPRMFNYLFHRVTKIEEKIKDNRSAHFKLTCTYLQIYQDNITDLLDPNGKRPTIRQDSSGGQVYVDGLQQIEIQNVDNVMALLKSGQENRKIAETSMNTESSRSHCILTCSLEIQIKEGGIINTRKSTLHLIDLAGSERYNYIEDTDKQRSKEMNYINKSLSTLGLVILKLSQNQSHVPYRDSKLTFLLQNSLGGNSRTVFIANVSPAYKSINETQSTLGFAQRAKAVKNKAHINEVNQCDLQDTGREKESLQREIQNYLEQLSKFIPANKQKYYQSPTKQLKYIFAYNEKLNQRNDHIQNQLLQTQKEKRELEFQVNQQQSIIDLMEQKYEQQQDELQGLQNTITLNDYNICDEIYQGDDVKESLDFSTPQGQSRASLFRPRQTSYRSTPSDFENFSFNLSDPSTLANNEKTGHQRNLSQATDQVSPQVTDLNTKQLPSHKEEVSVQYEEIIHDQQEEIQSLRKMLQDLQSKQNEQKIQKVNEDQSSVLNKQLQKAWQEIQQLQKEKDYLTQSQNTNKDMEQQSEKQVALKLVNDIQVYLSQLHNGQYSNKSNNSVKTQKQSTFQLDVNTMEELRQQIFECFNQKRSSEQHNNTLVLRNNQLQKQVGYVRNLQSKQYVILINLREMIAQISNSKRPKEFQKSPHSSNIDKSIDLSSISQEIETLGKLMRQAFQDESQIYSNTISPMHSDSSLQYPSNFQKKSSNSINASPQSSQTSPSEQFVLKSANGERTYSLPTVAISNDTKSSLPPPPGSALHNSQKMLKYMSPKLHISIPNFNPVPSPQNNILPRYPPSTISDVPTNNSDVMRSFDNEEQLCAELHQLHQQIQILQQSNQAMQLDNQMLGQQKEILIQQLQDNEKYVDDKDSLDQGQKSSPQNTDGDLQLRLEAYVEDMERTKCELEMILQNKIIRLDTLEESLEAMNREKLEVNRLLQTFKSKMQDWMHKRVGHTDDKSGEIEVEIESEQNNNSCNMGSKFSNMGKLNQRPVNDSLSSEKYSNVNTLSDLNKLFQVLFSELQNLNSHNSSGPQQLQTDNFVENAFSSQQQHARNISQAESENSQQLQYQFKQVLSKFLVLVRTYFCASEVEKIDMVDDLLSLLEVLTDRLLGLKETHESESQEFKASQEMRQPQNSIQIDRSLMRKRKQSHKRPQVLVSSEILSDEEEKSMLDLNGTDNANILKGNEQETPSKQLQSGPDSTLLSQSGVRKHDLQCQIQELKQERNYLQRMYQGSKTQIMQMGQEVENLKKRGEKERSLVKQLSKELRDQEEITAKQIQDNLTEQQVDLETKKSQISDLNQQIQSIQSELLSVRQESENRDRQIKSLENANQDLQRSNMNTKSQVLQFELERAELNKQVDMKRGVNESLEIQLGTQKLIVEKLFQDAEVAENQRAVIASLQKKINLLKDGLHSIKVAHHQSWIEQFQSLYIQAIKYLQNNTEEFTYSVQQPTKQQQSLFTDAKPQPKIIQVESKLNKDTVCVPLLVIDLWNQLTKNLELIQELPKQKDFLKDDNKFLSQNKSRLKQLDTYLESNSILKGLQATNSELYQIQVRKEFSRLFTSHNYRNGYLSVTDDEYDENLQNINSAFSTKLSFPPLSGSQIYNKSLFSQSIYVQEAQENSNNGTKRSLQPPIENSLTQENIVNTRQMEKTKSNIDKKQSLKSRQQRELNFNALASINMLNSQQWLEKQSNLNQLEGILKKLSWKQELFLKLSERVCWFIENMEAKLQGCVEKYIYYNNEEGLQNDLILQTAQSDEEIALDLQLLESDTEHHQLNMAQQQAQRSSLLINLIVNALEKTYYSEQARQNNLNSDFYLNQNSSQVNQNSRDMTTSLPQAQMVRDLPAHFQAESLQSSAIPDNNKAQTRNIARYKHGMSDSGPVLSSPQDSLDPSPMLQEIKPKLLLQQADPRSSNRDSMPESTQNGIKLYQNQGECTSYSSTSDSDAHSVNRGDELNSYSIQECTQSGSKVKSSNNSNNTPTLGNGSPMVKYDNRSEPTHSQLRDMSMPSIGQNNTKNEPRESYGVTLQQGVTPFQQAQLDFKQQFKHNFQQSLRLRDLEQQISQKELELIQEISPEFKNYCISFRCMSSKPNQSNQVTQQQQNFRNKESLAPILKSQSFSLQSLKHTPRFQMGYQKQWEENQSENQEQLQKKQNLKRQSDSGDEDDDNFDQDHGDIKIGTQNEQPSQEDRKSQLQNRRHSRRLSNISSFITRKMSVNKKKQLQET